MKRILFIIFCLIGLISNGQKSFVPASPYLIIVEQSDGTKLSLLGKGDEFLHYPVTEDGYTVIKNTKGIYEYADIDLNGELLPSGMAAKNIKDRGINDIRFLSGSRKNLKPDIKMPADKLKSAAISQVFPSQGQKRTLLLLIKYPDLDSSYTVGNFNNLMNQANYNGTGSMHDYYMDCSDSKLNLTVDVFGWYVAAHDHTYYGDNQPDTRSQELVREAIDAAHAAGVNFSLYDNDGDGLVENIMVVHSGPGAEEGSQTQYLWSHSWSLGSYSRIYNGVRINSYIIQPETRSYGMVGIGVFCHEFGHALGLPDLYDTTDNSEGLGNWCLMASGSWLNQEKTPSVMSAWCRKQLAWITPTSIPWPITEANVGTYSLQPAATSTDCYKILTQRSNEYFLLENKYKTGFNASLPGSGLAIFHVNTNQSNNDNVNLKLVDLEEADGLKDLDNNVNRGDAGDVYPGSTVNRVFDDFSNPNAQTYDPQATGINIRNITLNGSLVSFTLNTAQTPGPNLTYDPAYNNLTITGTNVSMNLRVKNSGNQSSGAFTVGYYLSTTLPVTTSGILLGTSSVSSLSALSFSNVSFTKDITTIPSLPTGNYYIGYVIDNTNSVTETNENDNVFSFTGQPISYTSLPNLTYMPAANSLYINGKSVSISMNVKNDGNSASRACSIGFYLSTDQNITTSDYLMTNDIVGILNAGQNGIESMSVDIPTVLPHLPSGHYYAGYIIDYQNVVHESNENDNTYCFSNQVFNYCLDNITEFNRSICNGQTALFNGNSYSTQGQYVFNYTGYNGCDSIVKLNLTVHQLDNIILNQVICSGESFKVGNNTYSAAGTYQNLFSNQFGCDSLVTLNLQVRQPQVIDLYRFICEGKNVKVGPYTYTQTGVYNAVFADRYGCDSTIIMHLTVYPVTDSLIIKTICQGEFVMIGNNSYSTTGIYTNKFLNWNGCDSTVTLNLTVNNQKEVSLSKAICQGDSTFMGGRVYKTPGVFISTLVSYTGCDSIVTLHLTVLPSQNNVIKDTICEGHFYTMGGTNYFSTGVYKKTMVNSYGCDSIVTLNLTVVPARDTVIYKEICEGDSVVIDNSVYKTNGNFIITRVNEGGCNYVTTLNLHINSANFTNLVRRICQGDSVKVGNVTYKTTGNYVKVLSNQFGCDSVVNLSLTVNPVSSSFLSKTICNGESVHIGSSVYSKSGIYTNHFTNQTGCDSVVTLDLKVRPLDETNLNYSVCQGDSIIIGSSVYKTTGHFTNLFINRFGCDSIINLNLTVSRVYNYMTSKSICENDSVVVGNSVYKTGGMYKDTLVSSAGCDSIITTQVILKPSYNIVLNRTICQGESYIFNSVVYKTSGRYYHTLANQFGCDSVIILNLQVNQPDQVLLSETICQGESFELGGTRYITTGIYSQAFVNQFGCDSIVTLNLKVNPVSKKTLDIKLCKGEYYHLGGIDYTETGTYEARFVNWLGCDSIVTLNLTINLPDVIQLTKTICQGGSVTIGDKTYNQPGIYTNKFLNHNGCDSTVILNLTVNLPDVIQLTKTICQGGSVTIGDKIYNQPGIYTNKFLNHNGCDSTVILNLTVNLPDVIHLAKTICLGGSVTIGNITYDKPGIYTNKFVNHNGCDSTVVLDLRFYPKTGSELFQSICSGESLFFGNSYRTTSGVYTHTYSNQFDCDSLVTLHLTVNPVSDTLIVLDVFTGDSLVIGQSVYKLTGIYTNVLTNYLGCDSVVTLHLTVKDKIPDSVFDVSGRAGNLKFSVFPNPAGRYVNIEIHNLAGEYRLKLISLDGKTMIIKEGKANSDLHLERLELNSVSKGIYSIVVESGGRQEMKKLVVR